MLVFTLRLSKICSFVWSRIFRDDCLTGIWCKPVSPGQCKCQIYSGFFFLWALLECLRYVMAFFFFVVVVNLYQTGQMGLVIFFIIVRCEEFWNCLSVQTTYPLCK